MVTINDIAKIAGVDKSTVSRALNNSERISKKVREKIKKIAQDLNYYPNASAYSLRKKMNRSIAIVLPELQFPGGDFFQEIIRGVIHIIQEHNFTLVFSTYSKEDNSFFRIVQENRIDGAIVLGDVFTQKELNELDKIPLPTFIVNYKLDNSVKNLIDIYSDNEYGGKLVAQHLIEVHKRKNILFIGGGDAYQANRHRLKGLKNFIDKCKQDIHLEVINGDFATAYKWGEEIVTDLIKKNKFNFDAIFAASDALAIGALNVLVKNSVKVPEDVSLISYDNIEVDNFYPIAITSVDQNANLIGRKAAEALILKILKKESGLEQGVIIEPELVIRSSCGCKAHDH